MNRLAFALAAIFLVKAPGQSVPKPEPYAKIYDLIRQAEMSSKGIGFLEDRSDPHSTEGRLYARAGYLDDAARAFAESPRHDAAPYSLWRAHVVYGDLPGAERIIDRISNPEEKASTLANLADLLWRMGKPADARLRFEKARQLSPMIPNSQHRARFLASIDQGIAYLQNEPPDLVSATPRPHVKPKPQTSPIPLFPITAGGFRDFTGNEAASRAAKNGEFITRLYDRMAAGDRKGIETVTESATTPFQKALGYSSIEHIFIQVGQPEAAEQYASKIQDVDSDSKLAKAEALNAAAQAWARSGQPTHAKTNFDAALLLAQSVRELKRGAVTVVLEVATAQSRAGMAVESEATLKVAEALAQDVPHLTGNTYPRPYDRDSAYEQILRAAIEIGNLTFAHDLEGIWMRDGGRMGSAIIRAWMDSGKSQEALVAANELNDKVERVSALLYLAQLLLDDAGAPSGLY